MDQTLQIDAEHCKLFTSVYVRLIIKLITCVLFVVTKTTKIFRTNSYVGYFFHHPDIVDEKRFVYYAVD